VPEFSSHPLNVRYALILSSPKAIRRARKVMPEEKRFKRRMMTIVVACALSAMFGLPARGMQENLLPHLRRQGTAAQLVVDGKPFLILGGELGNSTSSSLEYKGPVWPKVVSLNLNTLLVPVYWELIEPVEGKFDFGLVDGLIQEARRHQLRLVPLWFASWKNSMSCYAPAWVKTDQRRFPRAQDGAGPGMEILSPFIKENLDADARAFAAFMRHLRKVDGQDHTVIIVQVEKWAPGRWLNGDQTHQGRHIRLAPGKFDIQRVKLYRNR